MVDNCVLEAFEKHKGQVVTGFQFRTHREDTDEAIGVQGK